MSIGSIIKQARLNKGLTLEQVGQAVGVGKSTVLKWESGAISNMKRDKIAALAQVLDISPAVIMGWSSELLKEAPPVQPIYLNGHILTETEKQVILQYRNNPQMQTAVNTLLGVQADDDYYIPVAARNGNGGKVKVTSSEEERKAALDKVLPGVSTPKEPDKF